jgi:NAD(P)-dependent dehydrogenase (short-subunit alcohol dehydrogenase family)
VTASPFSLDGKQVLVVDASFGIGAATAQLCARLGARVTLCGADAGTLAQVCATLEGAGHAVVAGDLADVGDRQVLVAALPAFDGCVFAGSSAGTLRIDSLTQPHLDAVFTANVHGPLLLTQALLAAHKICHGAALVYVTGAVQHWAFGGVAVQAASNAALNAAVRALAVEHAGQGIRANCVAPGLVDEGTPGATQPIDTPGPAPLGKVSAGDIAAGIVYLLAPASRWVSRTSLVIDGGMSLHVR